MQRSTLIVTALSCEATPLIQAWEAKPLREHPCAERFQVFRADDTYIATTGIGKLRAAIATTALLTGLFGDTALFRGSLHGEAAPLLVNIGIAGSSDSSLPIGELTYCNKVRDVATNTRFYPDILVKHQLPEVSLETYDHPVTEAPEAKVVVDMEGSGIIQAAITLGAPSSVCLLKVISDHCSGNRVTADQASQLISLQTDSIRSTISAICSTLPEPKRLTAADRKLLESTFAHASLSLSQRIELQRRVTALQAQGIAWSPTIVRFLASSVSTKEARNKAYKALLQELSGAVSL
jgi:nucleoside phosphorylase